MMADPSAATAGEETTENKTRELVLVMLFACLIFAAMGAVAWAVNSFMGPADDRTPGFSVMVGDVVGGLDDPERSPVIQPALDLTLRVDNPTGFKMCWENATATVSSSYGDVVLGLGHLFQQLCVDKGASAEVKAALSRQVHVMLPDRLRGLMASKLRAGELELLVRLRTMVPNHNRYCGNCARDIVLHYCRVSLGHGFWPCNCHALEIAQMHQNF